MHIGGGRTPVFTAMSLAANGRGPPRRGLASEVCDASLTESASCLLVLSSYRLKDQARELAGGALGPPRWPPPAAAAAALAPAVVVAFDAAMAAACVVCEFGREPWMLLPWLRGSETAEPRREMLSSEVTSGIEAIAAMRAETRQVTTLGGRE